MFPQSPFRCFSTLYRVDAIEASSGSNGWVTYTWGFSTLYRVDAIEAAKGHAVINPNLRFSTLYRVDAIEARPWSENGPTLATRFSTLYRVDAIEAFAKIGLTAIGAMFQYPLSGRCY